MENEFFSEGICYEFHLCQKGRFLVLIKLFAENCENLILNSFKAFDKISGSKAELYKNENSLTLFYVY